MGKYSTGFSLIEVLCLLSLMLLGYFFVLPSCRQWISIQQCKYLNLQLESDLSWLSLQALILHQNLILDTDSQPMRVMVQTTKQTLKTLSMSSAASYQWHSKQALIFHANPLKNHVNGFFEINCSNFKKFKLWVNRLGHTRVES